MKRKTSVTPFAPAIVHQHQFKLHSQAILLYKKIGFAADGDECMQANIAHRKLILQLKRRNICR